MRRSGMCCVLVLALLGIAGPSETAVARTWSRRGFTFSFVRVHHHALFADTVAAGDGVVWAHTQFGQALEIGPTGNVIRTARNIPPAGSIAVGSDGAAWLPQEAGVMRITSGGIVSRLFDPATPIPMLPAPGAGVWGIGAVPKSSPVRAEIDQITPDGTVRRFALARGVNPAALAAGGDGSIWFSDVAHSHVGRLLADGSVRLYPLPGHGHGNTNGIAAGPHGTIWFTEGSTKSSGLARVGRIDTRGRIHEWVLRGRFTRPYGSIVDGPDGAMYFFASMPFVEARAAYLIAIERIGRDGRIRTVATLPLTAGPFDPHELASGPGHALWIAAGIDLARLTVPR